MQYTTNLSAERPIAITIGNFDGIHRGHQHLMQELRMVAQALHCTPVLLTFSPHTILVVRPDIQAEFLTTLQEKLELARQYGGVQESIIVHFTPEVAAMSAQDFLDELRAHFALKALVVGANFSLGHNREGDSAFLKQYGQEHDIVVRTIALAEAGQERISSTRIRALVSEGDIAEANRLLGHPHALSGIVRHGDERGRLIGFPTANLLPEEHKLLPANGVYAVQVRIEEEENSDSIMASSVYKGAANIGVRPTFNGKERLVEVHLLDVTLDLYGKRLHVDFIARLRAEQRFPSLDALKAQIAADAQEARRLLEATPLGG